MGGGRRGALPKPLPLLCPRAPEKVKRASRARRAGASAWSREVGQPGVSGGSVRPVHNSSCAQRQGPRHAWHSNPDRESSARAGSACHHSVWVLLTHWRAARSAGTAALRPKADRFWEGLVGEVCSSDIPPGGYLTGAGDAASRPVSTRKERVLSPFVDPTYKNKPTRRVSRRPPRLSRHFQRVPVGAQVCA